MQVHHKDMKELSQNEHKWMQRHIKVCSEMENDPKNKRTDQEVPEQTLHFMLPPLWGRGPCFNLYSGVLCDAKQ